MAALDDRRWGVVLPGRSRTTLSGLQGRHSGEKRSLSGSKTHALWYADDGREAKKETVA